jgi:hypothetical protein
MGREALPSAGVIDSQSVKITESGGPCGFDEGKKIKGRMRHIHTDTSGLLVPALVQAADIQARRRAQRSGLYPPPLCLAAPCCWRQVASGPARTRRLHHPGNQEIRRREGVCSVTPQMGRRTHLRLARPKQTLGEGP